MGRPFLDEDKGPLVTDGFRAHATTLHDFELMCAELGKSKSEIYRELMEEKLRRHSHIKRLRARGKEAS